MNPLRRTLLIGPLLAVLIILFQNCHGLSADKLSSFSTGGNGEPYSGKPELFYAFAEGFVCQNSSGTNVPSPVMIIEKFLDVYTLKESACVTKNEILPPENLVLDSSSFDFEFRHFLPAVPPSQFLQPTYQFVETSCLETLASRLMRQYGSPMLTPDEMSTAVADIVSTTIYSSYYGSRRASVVVKKNIPVQGPPPSPIESITHTAPDLLMSQLVDSVQYTRPDNSFTLTAARPLSAPADILVHYEATLDMVTGDTSLNNIQMTCSVFPH